MGCWWSVGPWCKVGLAEVEWSHVFVEHVILTRATEGFRKGRVSTEVVLVGARCRGCGFPRATVEIWQHVDSCGLRSVFVFVGFPEARIRIVAMLGWQLGRTCGFP